MTYNFDPEQWLENQTKALEARHERGELDGHELARQLDELEHRYQELVARLDGTYTVLHTGQPPAEGD
jgi:hypothetical protein